jgi:serine phosphatase RsbU (regulator of sigma subunit)
MSWLEVQPKGGSSHRIDIEPDQTIRIGRSGSNDLTLAEDPAVSRFHAEISFDGETCLVKDLGSHNGTYVEERRLTEPMAIGPGTWVTIGNTMIRLVGEEKSRANDVTSPMLGIESGESLVMSVQDIMESVHVPKKLEADEPAHVHAGPQLRAFATLNRAAGELLAQRPIGEVLELVIDMVFEIAQPDRAALMLLEGKPPALRTAASRGMDSDADRLQVSRTITDLVLHQQQALMTSDAQDDQRFLNAESVMLQNVRSAMCVPLWNNGNVSGLIYVDMQRGIQGFSKVDLEALTLVANVAAVKIDNVRLFLKEQKMKEMERELRAAAKIQQRLLPGTPPEIPGYEIIGYNKPCYDVGGDYFDYLQRDPQTLSFAVGDISGKGMSAALLMASLQASLHAHGSTRESVSELVSQLNRAVCRNSEDDKFSTFFYGEVDVSSGELSYCNAGHNPPLLFRAADGDVVPLKGGGMILGFDPDVSYETMKGTVQPGDLLVAYSDGVTESQNEDEEEFGESRLIRAVQEWRDQPVGILKTKIDSAVDEFVDGAGQFDDYTLVLLKRA